MIPCLPGVEELLDKGLTERAHGRQNVGWSTEHLHREEKRSWSHQAWKQDTELNVL